MGFLFRYPLPWRPNTGGFFQRHSDHAATFSASGFYSGTLQINWSASVGLVGAYNWMDPCTCNRRLQRTDPHHRQRYCGAACLVMAFAPLPSLHGLFCSTNRCSAVVSVVTARNLWVMKSASMSKEPNHPRDTAADTAHWNQDWNGRPIMSIAVDGQPAFSSTSGKALCGGARANTRKKTWPLRAPANMATLIQYPISRTKTSINTTTSVAHQRPGLLSHSVPRRV